jgi:apolipoprotein N-acyltransferase
MDFEHERAGRVRRALPALAAVVCSAVLFYFGTGLTPIAALTWLAPLPVLLLAPRVSGKAAVCAAFLAYFLSTTNSWGFYLHSHDEPMWPVGTMIIVGFSLTFVLAVWIFRRLLHRGRALLAVATAPAAWVGMLYLVSVVNPMGMVGTLATAQADVPLVLQTASVTGGWGVDYLVLLVPSAIAALLAPAVSTAARVRIATVTVVVLAAALGAGAVRLSNNSGTGPSQRVALIAHNHSGWGIDVATPAGRDLVAAYVEQVAALPDGVRTAVLPEGAFAVNDASLATLVQPLTQIARTRGLDIVVGLTRLTQGAKLQVALVIPAGGGEPVSYLKHHDRVSPPGHELAFLPNTPNIAGRVGVEICGDLAFPNPSRDYAQSGAGLMVIPASTEDDNGWQLSRTGLLRGVENGFAVAWSGRQGALLTADGWGRVLTDVRTGGPAPFSTAIADVPTGPGATPYTRLGDWFAWLCLALALGGLIASFLTRSLKHRGVTSPSALITNSEAHHSTPASH